MGGVSTHADRSLGLGVRLVVWEGGRRLVQLWVRSERRCLGSRVHPIARSCRDLCRSRRRSCLRLLPAVRGRRHHWGSHHHTRVIMVRLRGGGRRSGGRGRGRGGRRGRNWHGNEIAVQLSLQLPRQLEVFALLACENICGSSCEGEGEGSVHLAVPQGLLVSGGLVLLSLPLLRVREIVARLH